VRILVGVASAQVKEQQMNQRNAITVIGEYLKGIMIFPYRETLQELPVFSEKRAALRNYGTSMNKGTFKKFFGILVLLIAFHR
jgi:hypothetical protein